MSPTGHWIITDQQSTTVAGVTLRSISATLMAAPDPVSLNAVDFLVWINYRRSGFALGADDELLVGQRYFFSRWEPTAPYDPVLSYVFVDETDISPFVTTSSGAYTIREIAAWFALIYPDLSTQNSADSLVELHNADPFSVSTYGVITTDTPLSRFNFVLSWHYSVKAPKRLTPDRGSGATAVRVSVRVGGKRYLRMNQRDDGLGVARHPRLAGIGANNPTSVQSNRSTRLGTSNRYR